MLPQIDKNCLPRHIAIIMDGNGRWANEQGKDRLFGHYKGVESVRNTLEACAELGIGFLTLYAFSTENWNRPDEEVAGLMELLVSTIRAEVESLHKNNIKLSVIGEIDKLPTNARKELEEAFEVTKNNSGLNLIMALSYGGRWELVNAMKKIATKVKSNEIGLDEIDNDLLQSNLETAGVPDPELMIRTGGEYRISNFLLYQLAYSELYFADIHWPQFNKEHLFAAIAEYQKRERRFGKTGLQVNQLID